MAGENCGAVNKLHGLHHTENEKKISILQNVLFFKSMIKNGSFAPQRKKEDSGHVHFIMMIFVAYLSWQYPKT